jgi:hypothetical protein
MEPFGLGSYRRCRRDQRDAPRDHFKPNQLAMVASTPSHGGTMKVRHLEITTMIGCRVACVYCPQDKISHRYFGADRMMKFDDFKT